LLTRDLQSCFICSTPRTGSTLLCALLESTGVAGQPQSYFRKQDTALWAGHWGLPPEPDGSIDFAAFVQGALKAGRSPNGLFAVRIMWGTMDELAENLRGTRTGAQGPDIQLLHQAFGTPRFVFLQREDTLAQAVSWARAEQTSVWHRLEGSGSAKPARAAVYDVEQIDGLVRTIGEHNAAWREWFAANGVTPHPVFYEHLDADPVGTVERILDFLNQDTGKARQIAATTKRLADDLSRDWMNRYRRDTGRF
jgi:LPS sulfotransferase NodH